MLVSKYKRNKEVLVSDDDKCCFFLLFPAAELSALPHVKIHKVLGDVHHSHLLFVLFVLRLVFKIYFRSKRLKEKRQIIESLSKS